MDVASNDESHHLGPHPVILRIVLSQQQATDWRIDKYVTFHELLVSCLFSKFYLKSCSLFTAINLS